MLVIGAIVAGVATGMGIVVYHLRKAPVGFEDATGFHVVPQVKGSAILRYPGSVKPAAAGLKQAKAHL
jgi:hypothetical protein